MPATPDPDKELYRRGFLVHWLTTQTDLGIVEADSAVYNYWRHETDAPKWLDTTRLAEAGEPIHTYAEWEALLKAVHLSETM